MSIDSLYERINQATHTLGVLVEELGDEVYQAVESEELKRLAIFADVDHTREPTVVLDAIRAQLQRERDLNRELRRQIAAYERRERDGAG